MYVHIQTNAKRCTLLSYLSLASALRYTQIREATQLRASIRTKDGAFNEASDR
jgi:hypothetical protein